MDELLGKAGEDPLIEDLDLGDMPVAGTRITADTEERQPETLDTVLPEDDTPIPVAVREESGEALQWESSDSAAEALSHAARVKADGTEREETEAVWSGLKPEPEKDNFYVKSEQNEAAEETTESVPDDLPLREAPAPFLTLEEPEEPPKRRSSAGKKILLTAAVLLAVTAASYTIYGQK